MLIVSQDKDAIINFDNIANLVVLENNIVSICNIEEKTGITIAEYETEERAKEVLEEITFAYANMEMLKIPKIDIHQIILATEMIRNICYKMPEK